MRKFLSGVFVFLLAFGALAACERFATPAVETHATDLRSIVEEQIRSHVRESVGEAADQCVTELDLQHFLAEKVPDQIAASLRNSARFHAAVEKVRAMPSDERAAYLLRCRTPLHRTWRELGEISSKGQTEAGQQEEQAVAKAIVDLAERILAAPPGAEVK